MHKYRFNKSFQISKLSLAHLFRLIPWGFIQFPFWSGWWIYQSSFRASLLAACLVSEKWREHPYAKDVMGLWWYRSHKEKETTAKYNWNERHGQSLNTVFFKWHLFSSRKLNSQDSTGDYPKFEGNFLLNKKIRMKYCIWPDSKNVCGNKLSTNNPITCCLQNFNLLIISIHSESLLHYWDSLKVHSGLWNYLTSFVSKKVQHHQAFTLQR